MSEDWKKLVPTGEATAILPVNGGRKKPITVIGTEAIRATFCDVTLRQAINSRMAPGVVEVVLNPDAHLGYGAPVGCVMASPSHIYPGPVGVDIKCSMSLLQFDLPADQIEDRRTRRVYSSGRAFRAHCSERNGARSLRAPRLRAARSRQRNDALGARCGELRPQADAHRVPRRGRQR